MSIPRISEAEWAVMEVLWASAPATARDVHAALGSDRDWTLHTVKTLLARLLDKGALDHEVEGKRYLYSPAVSREECVREESRSFLERVHRGEASPLLARFLGEGKLSRREIRQVRALLDRLEKEE